MEEEEVVVEDEDEVVEDEEDEEVVEDEDEEEGVITEVILGVICQQLQLRIWWDNW